MRARRLSDADWQHLFWTAGLSEPQGDVFLRREVWGEGAFAVARHLGRPQNVIRAHLSDAWRKLRAHPWSAGEIAWVREKLARGTTEAESRVLRQIIGQRGLTIYRPSRIVGVVR